MILRSSVSAPAYFIGYCWGGAGSRWLARLLNSHRDILCLHSPQLPRFDESSSEDELEVIRHFFDAGRHGHPVIGFTHGISLDWKDEIEAEFRAWLRCFVIVRHPIKRIRSVVALCRRHQAELGENWEQQTVAAWQPIAEEFVETGAGAVPTDFRFLSHLYACKMVTAIREELKSNYPIFRIEDLGAEVSEVRRLLGHISAELEPMPEETLAYMQSLTVGSHAGSAKSATEIWHSWAEDFKDAFRRMVPNEILSEYQRLGYVFPELD